MAHARLGLFSRRDRILIATGFMMAVCFAAIVALPVLLGPPLKRFLVFFLSSAVAYGVAVLWLDRAPLSARGVWAFAILFRLTLLLSSPPSLSTDVYRYIWDGRLANAGVSPYAHAVDSPLLDRFDSPQRALVNHAWMASPYLPVSQMLFAAVYRVVPDSPFAFQVAAILLDLLTGWLVMNLLRQLGLPPTRVLIYLWNPLIVVEFAHGAHMDVLMICLMMVSLWSLIISRRVPDPPPTTRYRAFSRGFALLRRSVSPVALAAATLTKGIPALLLPVVIWRWGAFRTLLYVVLVVMVLLPLGLGSGWGLTGPRVGEGMFGALRIYGADWNYNSGFYHWVEVAWSGFLTSGAVPLDIAGEMPIWVAKLIVAALLLGVVLLVVTLKARHCEDDVGLLRIATVPLGAFLLLTTTVHPWYVSVIIPLLSFLLPRKGETTTSGRFIWPWVFFSAAVSLSYLTYLDPANLREYDWVRLAEYVPFYLLLIWAAWPAKDGFRE